MVINNNNTANIRIESEENLKINLTSFLKLKYSICLLFSLKHHSPQNV